MKIREDNLIDFMGFKIEKSLKNGGFTLKRDSERKIKVLMKIKDNKEKEMF